jgi:condensation domain-containing protein
MVEAAQQLVVDFEGDGAGEGVLSWGQREIWHVIKERKTWLPIGAVQELPAGYTVDDAVADLRFVMSRYPSMRTRLRFDQDTTVQVVSGSGQITLDVVDAADDDDPAMVADQVWQDYRQQDYDFVTDWPVRMAVIRHRGALTHRPWVMCHLVTDGTGSRVILADLADRDGSATGTPPLEQARWQQSPAGERQCAAALRHWEKVLRTASIRRFPERTEKPNLRYREAKLDSPAAELALRAISARTGVEVPSVLLTVFAVALVRVTGVNPVMVVLVVNNRFRPGLARTVSPIIQPALCVLEVPEATIDAAAAYTRRRAITAYKYAYYDPPQREDLIAQVNKDRGETVDLECSLNDIRLRPRDTAGPPPTADQIRAALPSTTFEWTQEQDHRPYDKLYVTVEDVPGSMRLVVNSDAHHLSPADIEALARGMEEVAVAAALDPGARTGVAGPH